MAIAPVGGPALELEDEQMRADGAYLVHDSPKTY
jgi:hypothetical protein